MIKKRLSNLLCVKSLITLAFTATFIYLTVNDKVITDWFSTTYGLVIGCYFGVQMAKPDSK